MIHPSHWFYKYPPEPFAQFNPTQEEPMKRFHLVCLLAVVLFSFPMPFRTLAANTARVFPLPDHGSLHLQVPSGWVEKVRQPPHRLPPTILLTPRAGAMFKVLVTPF